MKSVVNYLCLTLIVSAAHAIEIRPSDFERVKQSPPFEIVAPRAIQAPAIDGELSDAAWSKAAAIKSFWHAGTVNLSKDQSIAWLCFDKDNLYIAFACLDKKVVGAAKFGRDTKDIWKNDCVEVFLSPERDPKLDRQFVLGVGNGRYDRRAGGEGRGGVGWNPEWEGKAKLQPWGYTAEIRIPFASVLDVKKYPVNRGTVWLMKFTREDWGNHTGCLTSSWTMIGQSTGDAHAWGKLIFEDRNLFLNGGAEKADAKGVPTGWESGGLNTDIKMSQVSGAKTEGNHAVRIEISGKKEPSHYTVHLGHTISPVQPVETTYRFSADVKFEITRGEYMACYFRVRQGGVTEGLSFKAGAGWQKIGVFVTVKPGESLVIPNLHGGGDKACMVHLDNLRLEVVDPSAVFDDPDERCLTANAAGAFHTRNRRVNGSYTYTRAMTNDPAFPFYFHVGPKQDYGLYRGNIPFEKGIMTDGFTATGVGWAHFWKGHQGFDIKFDMGKEYVITRVEVLANRKHDGGDLWLKSPGEPRFTLASTKWDLFDFNTGKGPVEVGQFVAHNKLNQRARWIRVQNKSTVLHEIRIWGKELPKGKTLKRVPYLQAGGEAPVKNPKSEPEVHKDIPPVFPLPQEMKFAGPAGKLSSGMVIAYEPANSERSKITAEVLRDEMKQCYGLEMTVSAASEENPGDILIGEAIDSPLTSKALASANQKLSTKSPGKEGYVLIADGNRIVIGGSDYRGAFYGTQALLTLTRKSGDDWEVPGATIRDRPDIHFRFIEGRPVPTKNLIRALARFRISHYVPPPRYMPQAAEFDPVAERYCVSFIPNLDHRLVVQKDPQLAERAPGEELSKMATGRRVPNPAHPRTWEIYYAECDKWLPQFHGDVVFINYDETYMDHAGARWNVSKESRALKLTGGQLQAYFLNKIDKKFKEFGKRIFMHDTLFAGDCRLSYPGDPDPSWNKAIPLVPKDIIFNVWHPRPINERLGPKGFDLVHLVLDDTTWEGKDYPGPYAGINNYMGESAFTPSKLLDTAWVAWNTKAIRPHAPQADIIVSKYISLWNQLHQEQSLPVSFFAKRGDYQSVDIRRAANRSRIDEIPFDGKGWVDLGPNMDLRALPGGMQEMAGVPFQIIDESQNHGKSVVMVENQLYADRTMSGEVEIETADLKAASLIFLHCLDNRPGWHYLRRKEIAGFYFMVYEDGTYSAWDIKYATSTANWDGKPTNKGYSPKGHTMNKGKLAWRGETTSGMEAFLYMTEWINPRPDLKIKKIIFRAAFSPGNMNPMLLAITATAQGLGRVSAKPNPPLPSADKLKAPKMVGLHYDLSGGKDESESRYVAPDGTIISSKGIDNYYSDKLSFPEATGYRSYVGLVNFAGTHAALTETLFYTFPKSASITGALVTARYRVERKVQDFPPSRFDIFLDVSDDGGKTWKLESEVRATSPEAHGPVWLPIRRDKVQHLRLRAKRTGPSGYGAGFTSVKIYRRTE